MFSNVCVCVCLGEGGCMTVKIKKEVWELVM